MWLIASAVRYPSCSWARCSIGIRAERVSGYSAMRSRARSVFSVVSRAIRCVILVEPRGAVPTRMGVYEGGLSPWGGRFFELDRDAPDGVVLAQRVSLPVLGHQDPAEVGVADEHDAEHVVRLPLGRLAACPQGEQGGDAGIGFWHLGPDPDPVVLVDRAQVDDDLEALGSDRRRDVPDRVGKVVDATHVDAHVEA